MSRPFQLLLEIQYLKGVLLESRLDYLRNKYIPLIKHHVGEIEDDREYKELIDAMARFAPNQSLTDDKFASVVFDWLASIDPERSKKHLQWLLNVFLQGGFRPEDAYKATEYLTLFDRVQRNLPVEHRDLNRLKNLRELFAVIQPYQEVKSQRQIGRDYEEEMNGQARVVFDTARYKIVVPLTQQAACHFGINTQWCTAAREDNRFDDYYEDGDLFIILDKQSNKRWQFHFETQQFMDENDHMIDGTEFRKLHPEVFNFFKNSDDSNTIGRFNDYYVIKTSRGIAIKDMPGLYGSVKAFFNVDANGNLTTYNFDLINDENACKRLADLFNEFKIKGNPTGDRISYVDLYYRNNLWGTIRQLGTPIVKIKYAGQIGEWKKIEVPKIEHSSSITHYELDAGDEKFAASLIDNESFFTSGDADDNINRHVFSSIYMPLIQAEPNIIFWNPQFTQFDRILPNDKEWLLKNRPMMCPPAYVYENLGATDVVKEIVKKWIDCANIFPHEENFRWIDDLVVMKNDHVVESILLEAGLKIKKPIPFREVFYKIPFIYHFKNDKLVKGLKKDPVTHNISSETQYFIGISLGYLIAKLSRPFDEYHNSSWANFLVIYGIDFSRFYKNTWQ